MVGVEVELYFADGAVAVFLDEKFGDVGWFVALFILVIIIWAVKHHNEVGVLLNRARVAKIGKNWARVVAAGDITGELSEGNYWDI